MTRGMRMGQRVAARRAFALAVGVALSLLAAWWQLSDSGALPAAQAAQAAQASLAGGTAPAAQAGADGVQRGGAAARIWRPVAVEPAQEFQIAATPEHPAYVLYVPGGPIMPRAALLALHGMGGNGPAFASLVVPYARSQNWVVVAPNIPYGDWRDPAQLAGEELRLQPQLAALLDAIPAETGVELEEHVLAFGFSRGAQAALRFAMLYPERVGAVAALSAGTYTLPIGAVTTVAGDTVAAPLPFGVADIEQRAGRGIDQESLTHVRFLIGVGAGDNRDGDVPRQWDVFVGKNRVERAQRFADALTQLGYRAQVAVVPGVAHEVNAAMLEPVTGFLTEAAAEAQAQAEAATTAVPVVVPAPVVGIQ